MNKINYILSTLGIAVSIDIIEHILGIVLLVLNISILLTSIILNFINRIKDKKLTEEELEETMKDIDKLKDVIYNTNKKD